MKRSSLAHVRNACAAVVAALLATTAAQAQTLSNIWTIQPGNPSYPFIDTGGSQRAVAYNALSNQVVVASRTGGNGAHILDADTAAYFGSLNMTGIGGGDLLAWNMLVIADDGVVYGFNVATTPTSMFKIYRWGSTETNTPPTVAFSGDPGYGITNRWGDAVDVRGSGVNTEILAGTAVTGARTNVALFTTTDGTNFTPIRIDISGIVVNDLRYAVSFYTNNTFFIKQNGQPLRLIQYTIDTATTGTGLVLTNFTSGLHVVGASPEAELLAGITTGRVIELYDISDLSTGPVFLSSTNFATANANGNLTGDVEFGGQGGTNRLFALWSNNGIVAAAIVPPAPDTPPTVVTQPAAQAVYDVVSNVTFTVTATGTMPLHYQWQFNSNNIAGATNVSLVISNPAVSDSGFYRVAVTNTAGTDISADAELVVLDALTTPVMTTAWSLATGSRSYLTVSDLQRGMAYDPATTNLVLVSRASGANIHIIDADTGADEGTLNTLGITIGTFPLNMIGVADDGAVYAGNLSTGNPANFALYRWGSVDSNTLPTFAFGEPSGGDPGLGNNQRWGDTMDVRGAGTDTRVLLGSRNGSIVSILTTADGLTFTPNVIDVTGAPAGFAGLGIAFGSGNTFWAKSVSQTLRQVSFDPGTGVGTIVQEFAFADVPAGVMAIGVDSANNLLGAIELATPDNLQLYHLSGTSDPPTVLDQEFFPTDNVNGNGTGAVDFGNGRIYALDSNNGLIARNIDLAAVPFDITSIVSQAGPAVVITWESVSGATYQVQFKNLVTDASWTDVGSPVAATGATASFTNNVGAATQRYYRVVKQ